MQSIPLAEVHAKSERMVPGHILTGLAAASSAEPGLAADPGVAQMVNGCEVNMKAAAIQVRLQDHKLMLSTISLLLSTVWTGWRLASKKLQ